MEESAVHADLRRQLDVPVAISRTDAAGLEEMDREFRDGGNGRFRRKKLSNGRPGRNKIGKIEKENWGREQRFLKNKKVIRMNQLAEGLVKAGRYKEAIRLLNQAREKDPRNAVTVATLGKAHLALEHYPQAEQALRESLDIDDHNMPSYTLLAKVFRQQGRYSDAVKVVQQALQKEPLDVLIRVLLADIYDHLGWYQEALGVAQDAVKYADQNDKEREQAAASYALVRAFDRLGEYGEALPVAQKAFARDRERGYFSYITLAKANGYRDDYLKAIQILDEGLQQYPKESKILFLKALYLREWAGKSNGPEKSTRLAESGRIVERILDSEPNNAYAGLLLAQILFDGGERDRALQQVQRLVKQFPEDFHLYLVGIHLYHRRAREEDKKYFSDAEQFAEPALNKEPKDFGDLKLLAEILHDLGRYTEALHLLWIYLEKVPGDRKAQSLMLELERDSRKDTLIEMGERSGLEETPEPDGPLAPGPLSMDPMKALNQIVGQSILKEHSIEVARGRMDSDFEYKRGLGLALREFKAWYDEMYQEMQDETVTEKFPWNEKSLLSAYMGFVRVAVGSDSKPSDPARYLNKKWRGMFGQRIFEDEEQSGGLEEEQMAQLARQNSA